MPYRPYQKVWLQAIFSENTCLPEDAYSQPFQRSSSLMKNFCQNLCSVLFQFPSSARPVVMDVSVLAGQTTLVSWQPRVGGWKTGDCMLIIWNHFQNLLIFSRLLCSGDGWCVSCWHEVCAKKWWASCKEKKIPKPWLFLEIMVKPGPHLMMSDVASDNS